MSAWQAVIGLDGTREAAVATLACQHRRKLTPQEFEQLRNQARGGFGAPRLPCHECPEPPGEAG